MAVLARAATCMVCFGIASPATCAALRDPTSMASDVLAIVDARLALMPDVAAAKWATGQPVADPAREVLVIRAAGERAAAVGLAPAPVEALFELQVGLARAVQEALHARWRRDGSAPPGPAPSLANDLRPQIDRQTADLLVALYVAAPTLPTTDLRALATARLPAARWSDADRDRVVAALASIHLAAPRSPERARAAGVLRIGTPADYAPFALARDDRLDGSDVELGERLATALGLQPVFVQTRWSSIVDDLEVDRFDVGVGGVSVTDARRLRAAFSMPTAHGGKTAVGRCADRDRYQHLEDIDRANVRVVENAGGTNEAFARRHLHNAALRIHPDNRTVMDELVTGRADVMFTDDTEVALVAHQQRGLCRLLEDLYDPTDKAFLLPHDGLWTATVDAWLRAATAAGIPALLLERHLAR
jgi:cyclohexadienyl dehydratase